MINNNDKKINKQIKILLNKMQLIVQIIFLYFGRDELLYKEVTHRR